MKCKYCKFFNENRKKRIEWVTDKKKSVEKYCDYIGDWVNSRHPICENFSITKIFWCKKLECFMHTEACIYRQSVNDSCVYGCKEKKIILDLMTYPIEKNIEQVNKKLKRKNKKIQKQLESFNNKETINEEKEKTKSRSKKKENVSISGEQKKKRPRKKKEKVKYEKAEKKNEGTHEARGDESKPNDGTTEKNDGEQITTGIPAKRKSKRGRPRKSTGDGGEKRDDGNGDTPRGKSKRGRPRKSTSIDSNDKNKKILKRDIICEFLSKEKKLRKIEKTDKYVKFISGIERGKYIFVGKRGGIKYGKTWEESIPYKLENLEG